MKPATRSLTSLIFLSWVAALVSTLSPSSLKFSRVSPWKVSNRLRSPAAAALASILALVSAALTAMALVLAAIFRLVVSKRSSTSVRKSLSSLRSSSQLFRASVRSLSRYFGAEFVD